MRSGVLGLRVNHPLPLPEGRTAMRIAIVGNSDIVKFRRWLIRDLVAAGHTVSTYAPQAPGLAGALSALGAVFFPISLARTGTNPIRDLRDFVALAEKLRSLGADIVLAHSTKVNILATLAARMAGVPRIFVMLEGLGYAFTDGREIKRALLRVLLLTAFRLVFPLCTGLFVLNTTDQEFVRRARVVSKVKPVFKINGTGIDLTEFAYSPPPTKGLCFLLIARILRSKGILEYIEAARILRAGRADCRFWLVGPLDTNPEALSIAEAKHWHRNGAVEYLGETADVRPYLRACSVFVLPSYREGMPRTILEALAVGRAVVTTHAPGCSETVVDGWNGFLVPPRDVAALVAALQRFIDDPSLISSMARSSRILAEERFDVQRVNASIMQAMGIGQGPGRGRGESMRRSAGSGLDPAPIGGTTNVGCLVDNRGSIPTEPSRSSS
jgi:glycosyltransferase involved in cell wall biosynthesis